MDCLVSCERGEARRSKVSVSIDSNQTTSREMTTTVTDLLVGVGDEPGLRRRDRRESTVSILVHVAWY